MSMLRVEFHCHTIYSKDSLLKISLLVKSIKRKRIDRIAITDHNTIRGALRAKELAPEHVIVGEEIMTTKGELLAYFMTKEIKPHLSPQETINQLREQEAFISVAHPFDRFRKGHWDSDDLLQILPFVDAIEVFCPNLIPGQMNLLGKIINWGWLVQMHTLAWK
jgi:predicted metal-dependent phosphoesterase TrpH